MPSTLCVPIDLKAYCVGSSDTARTQRFAGAQTDYSQLPFRGGRTGVSLISRDTGVLRPVDDPPLNPLRAGVHLHWALPRSLTIAAHRPTQGQTDDDGEFPAVPNRWLLTRVLTVSGQRPQLKSWVIESDYLSTSISEAQGNAESVTLFTGNPTNDQQPFRYLGRAVDAAVWQETVTGPSALKTLTGKDLTAVTSGDPMFAAFYPNCPNVFGFHDDLADVHLSPSSTHKILYSVQGWYSDGAQDPLHGGMLPAAIEEEWGWQVSGHDQTNFNRSMFHGIVQQIDWQASRSYVETPTDGHGDGTPIQADVAVGLGGAEALSALLGKAIHDEPHRQAFERLLTAYQVGTLTGLNDPLPDRSATLDDRLHKLGFGHVQAGDQWTVVNHGTSVHRSSASKIPAHIAEAVAQLNRAQAAYDQKRHEVESCKQQLYSDWFRYNLAWQENDEDDNYQGIDPDDISDYVDTSCLALFHTDDPTDPSPLLTHQLSVLHQACLSKKATAEHLIQQANSHDPAHPENWQLKRLAAPWYWHSNEPVVALSHVELDHRLRGQRLTDPLPCRADDQLISAISVIHHRFSQLLGAHTLPTAPVPLATVLNEALLLNSAWFAQHSVLAQFASLIVQGFKDLIAQGQGNAAVGRVHGVIPAALGAQWWNGQNPWQPLFMAWECFYHSAPNYDGLQQDYPTNFVTNQFSLDEGGVFSPDFLPSANGGASGWTLQGQSILTPLLTVRLEHALHQNHDADLQTDVQSALHYLETTPIVFQGLTGFNDQLLMRQQVPRLSTLSTNTGDESGSDQNLADETNHIVGHTMCQAPRPHQKFIPIRGGHAGFSFRLIDTFGHGRAIQPTQFSCSTELRDGNSEANQLAYLPPRITQPSRLNFQFLSATDATQPSGTVLSPVCGWLLPNHLEHSLMFYDDQGIARGSLSAHSGQMHWLGAPGPNYGQGLNQALQGSPAALKNFAIGLNQAQTSFFDGVLETVRRVQDHTTPAIAQDPSLAMLIGRPMALVQVQIELELMGAPATNQSWAALQTDLDTADEDHPSTLLTRAHNASDAVQFEILLGNLNRLHDGLIGFFVQDRQGGYDYSQFYSPGSDHTNASIVDAKIRLAANQGPVHLLMLVSPLAKLHAVSGILPTQAITLPASLCVPALHGLSVTFPTRPVLSPVGHDRSFPLPPEPGYQWRWLQHTSSGWQTHAIDLQKPSVDRAFSQQEISSGWLLLEPVGS